MKLRDGILMVVIAVGVAGPLSPPDALGSPPALPLQNLVSGSASHDESLEDIGEFRSNGDTPPFDVLAGQVDNAVVYRTFLNRGRELIGREGVPSPAEVDRQLKQRSDPVSVSLGATERVSEDSIYESMLKSTLMIGVVYNCGKCSNLHANIAGGVVISEDGLALTNYHVVSRNDPGVESLVAMTHDGRCLPIVEVLSASRRDDVALIRLGTDGLLHPSPLAGAEPRPLETARILSHPRNEYFVLTEGVVSRHVQLPPDIRGPRWMEVTAEFAAGSSGSAVFNERGEIIGLVSRVLPIMREPSGPKPGEPRGETSEEKAKNAYAELILRRCVPLDAIRARLERPSSER